MTFSLPINLTDLLTQRTIESERVEYKSGWNPQSVLHTLCAFANDFHNLGGGYIVIGVEEKDGRPILPPKGIDVDDVETIQKGLLHLEYSAMQPLYHPLTAVYEVSGKTILVIWAPGGETRPYKAKVNPSKESKEWAYYLRKNSSTLRAKGDDERELLSLAATVPFDDRYNQIATLQDLSPRLIAAFLREVGSELADQAAHMPIEDLARQLSIVGGPVERPFPKNVGLLFFNEAPHQFFPVTQIDVVWFPEGAGADRFEEKIFRGPLDRIARDAIDFVERYYIKETIIKHPDRSEAERFWNFPRTAIEEAIINAVYHRSYEIREPIEVRISPEDLVVLSFPGPDRSIRMEDLRAGKAVSRRYRNRRIGEFLKDLELTEGRSTGMPKIFKAMQRNGSPPPELDSDEDRSYFLIRLPVHRGVVGGDEFQSSPQGSPQSSPQSSPQVNQSTEDEFLERVASGRALAEDIRKAILILCRHQHMTVAQLASRLHRKPVTIQQNYVSQLCRQGFLELKYPLVLNHPAQAYRTTDKPL